MFNLAIILHLLSQIIKLNYCSNKHNFNSLKNIKIFSVSIINKLNLNLFQYIFTNIKMRKIIGY